MKKRLSIFITIIFTVSVFTGCYIDEPLNPDKFQVSGIGFLVNDYVGDKSYSDEINDWLRKSRQDLNIYYKTFENAGNEFIYEESVISASEDKEVNLIIAMGDIMLNIIEKHAPQYPNKKYIVLDVDSEYNVISKNVLAISFDQTEAQFIVGTVAAMATKSKIISFIGGVLDKNIKKQVASYLTGAVYVEKDIKAKVDYTGDFVDTLKVNNLVSEHLSLNSDVIYASVGYATLEALSYSNKSSSKFITDGMNNYDFLKKDNQKNIDKILVSPFKNMGEVLYNILKENNYQDDNFGKTKILSLKDDGVKIIKSDNLNKQLTQDQISQIDNYIQKIKEGKLLVPDFSNIDESYYNNMVSRLNP